MLTFYLLKLLVICYTRGYWFNGLNKLMTWILQCVALK